MARMPFFARTLGLMLAVVVSPALLYAQNFAPFPDAREPAPVPNPMRYDVRPAGYDAPLPPAERTPGLLPPPATPAKPAPAAESPAEKSKASVPLASARQEAPIPLPPPGSSSRSDSAKSSSALPSALTVAASLATVLGIFFLAVWLLRRATPRAMTALPKEVVEVLGRAPLSGRQQMHLLRCGNKLLLVSVTPAGAETLTEITDPVEIDRLAGLCQQTRPGSATATFRRVFQHFVRHDDAADPADDHDAATSTHQPREDRYV
jgi:flagellar biogenesis protein FliO